MNHRGLRNGLVSLSFGVLFIAGFMGCDSPPNENAESTTTKPALVDTLGSPNKRSELAILMRNLYDDLKKHRAMIAEGGKSDVEWSLKYESMPTATQTDPGNAGPQFDAFAQQYLLNLKSFEEADSNRVETFNRMIDNCLVCHQQYCQGPMGIIGKLKI
ncbi:hypothetical protein KFE98_00305 [bacterium SCSIO 12741]|nr:hypothetical protein KFE98_00305 [bacterium SCSIO 12741]